MKLSTKDDKFQSKLNTYHMVDDIVRKQRDFEENLGKGFTLREIYEAKVSKFMRK